MDIISASYSSHTLQFKNPAGTSRGILNEKLVRVLKIRSANGLEGTGECSPLKGLSVDDIPDFELKLKSICDDINNGIHPEEFDLNKFPSINFGLESAILDLKNGGIGRIFNNGFFDGNIKIPINGLVWMGPVSRMLADAEEKITEGFKCLKFKIGALDFDEECRMLEKVRRIYNPWKLEIRVDANGAFKPEDAEAQLKDLAKFELHSIEQPIKAGQWDEMALLCKKSNLPIALDEDLIGINKDQAGILLRLIKPQYIIIKPGLLGGYKNSDHWISEAEKNNIGYWITSALESNIGLNAIAQYTAERPIKIPQGLGTGQLYNNNFESGLMIRNGFLINT